MSIKSRAAVAFAAGQPLQIVEVDVEAPKAGEVLVRIIASGVCHTDAFTLSGDDPEGIFPSILGVPINFQPAFYFHLALLHFSLALRIVSDLLLWNAGRMWGGMLNEIAILLFLGMTIYSVRKGMRAK